MPLTLSLLWGLHDAQVLTIHLSNPAGDILIFMTGQEDIETTCEVLADRVSELEGVPPLLVLPMYSQVRTTGFVELSCFRAR